MKQLQKTELTPEDLEDHHERIKTEVAVEVGMIHKLFHSKKGRNQMMERFARDFDGGFERE